MTESFLDVSRPPVPYNNKAFEETGFHQQTNRKVGYPVPSLTNVYEHVFRPNERDQNKAQ